MNYIVRFFKDFSDIAFCERTDVPIPQINTTAFISGELYAVKNIQYYYPVKSFDDMLVDVTVSQLDEGE